MRLEVETTMRTLSLSILGLLAAGLILFQSVPALSSCRGCELDDSEKDAAYFACVKYHKDNKTADDNTVERLLCREPAARVKGPAIAACIRGVKDAGFQYGNMYDVCADALGFEGELDHYLACFKAEAPGAKMKEFASSEALSNCAIKAFRDDRAGTHACMSQADTYWPSKEGSNAQKLVPICTDPEKKAALPQIVDCTNKIAVSALFPWRISDSFQHQLNPLAYIDKCMLKETRAALGPILACRARALDAMTREARQANIFEQLVKGGATTDENGDRFQDAFSREAEEVQQLDQCVTDANFRANEDAILACAIENVKAFKRIPFASVRYIDGGHSAYATLEAEGKCATPEARQLQHRALACMRNVTGRLPASDLEELGNSERTPEDRAYLWCEMTEARELGAAAASAPAPAHCPL